MGKFDLVIGLGSSKNTEPIRLPATEQALIDLAIIFKKEAEIQLNKVDRVSTGSLTDSIVPLDPVVVGNRVVLDIEVNEYYKFVNKGVKGTKKGSGEYSFKNDKPSRNMVAAIRQWMVKENMKIQDRTKNKVAIVKREAKRMSAKDSGASPYAVARSIKQKGLKATHYWDKAVEVTERKSIEKFQKALQIDILNIF